MPRKLPLELCQAACTNDTTCSWIVMNSNGCYFINSNFCDTSNMFPQTGSTLGTKRNKTVILFFLDHLIIIIITDFKIWESSAMELIHLVHRITIVVRAIHLVTERNSKRKNI